MSKLPSRAVGLTALTIAWLGSAISPALAGPRHDFDLGFTTSTPRAATGFDAHFLYKHPDDPEAKPPPLVELEIELPAGTRFDTTAVPACTASDEELRVSGPSACPAESQVGTGTFVGLTGVAPADPFVGDILIFNTGDALLEVVVFQGTETTAGTDRPRRPGGRRTAAPSPGRSTSRSSPAATS